jgi:hypothetical protein
VISFFGSTFGFGLSDLPSLNWIFGPSNQLVINNAHDGLTKTICECFKGVSSSVELGNFFKQRERINFYASTFVTQDPTPRKPTKKRGKRRILRRYSNNNVLFISLG